MTRTHWALLLATALVALIAPRCAHSASRFTVHDAYYVLTSPTDATVCTMPPLWDAADRALCRATVAYRAQFP